jgi:TolB-like protein/lipopolysaccharide biosynthesis regulator YciM
MLVIDRNSTFTYKGKTVKVQQVAEELGVQYVLEGSVQKSGDRLRVTAQLIDALGGHHLWSEKYDREMKGLFDLQDEITKKIVVSLEVEFGQYERARIYAKSTNNLEAWSYVIKGFNVFMKFNKQDNAKARELFEKAIRLDPEYSMAWAWLSLNHANEVRFGWSESPVDSLKRAKECLQKALALDDENSLAHAILGLSYLGKHQHDKAVAAGTRAISLDPNSTGGLACFSFILHHAGRFEEAIEQMKKAIRLGARYHAYFLFKFVLNYAFLGRYDEAIAALNRFKERCRKGEFPMGSIAWAQTGFAVVYVELGRVEEARALVAEAQKVKPGLSLERFKRPPYKDPVYSQRLIENLRKAGLPETPPLPLPDKPSIAVLPFTNMSGDPEQEYFSDGITEDIITNLSKVSGLFVISRNSSFLYKGKQVKIKDVGRDLRVRYVLEGSVRRAGNKVRVTAQLIDGKTEHHVWADSYDRELKDIFSVQDDVTQKVVSELAIALTVNEVERLARKHTENFEAYEMFLRARREMTKLKKENQLKAQESFKRVIELDPNFAGGYACFSFVLSRSVRFGYSSSPREDVEKALKMAKKAISVDNTFWFSYQALASAYLMKRRHDDALAAITEAVRIQPSLAQAHLFHGFYLHWMGRGEEAVQAIEKALQLNPKYLSMRGPVYLDLAGYAYFTAGRYEESIAAWKKAIDHFGPLTLRLAFLTASYSELGRNEEAKAMAHQLLQANPKFNPTSWKYARTYKNPEDTERLLNALRRAGLK